MESLSFHFKQKLLIINKQTNKLIFYFFYHHHFCSFVCFVEIESRNNWKKIQNVIVIPSLSIINQNLFVERKKKQKKYCNGNLTVFWDWWSNKPEKNLNLNTMNDRQGIYFNIQSDRPNNNNIIPNIHRICNENENQ